MLAISITMKPSVKSRIFKFLKISGISIFSVLALLFILPYLFPETISRKIKEWVNGAITSKLEFSKVNLSFYNHFPSLTLTLQDVTLTGSRPFENDTLIKAREIALGLDLTTIFSSSIKINKIYLSNADVAVQVNSKGQANYNIYKSGTTTSDSSKKKEDTGLQLENIVIENSHISYDDQSIPLQIEADNFNYTGKGDLTQSVFDLSTRMSADAFSFIYNGEAYINKKELRARLVTKVNTNSLALVFEKNRLRINRLPVQFSGRFDFLKSGYDMDFQLASPKATLEQIISAIPPDLSTWLDDTEVKGDAAFNLSLKGQYIVESHSMPTLEVFTRIRNGYISHKKAPVPVENLFVTMAAKLPSLNTDSLEIKLDTLNFTLDKGFLEAQSYTVGLEQPYIKSKVKASVDLGLWDEALGLEGLELKGLLNLDLNTAGKYSKSQDPAKWRKHIVVTSIPKYTLDASLKNGYLKYASLPEAIKNISFDIKSNCRDSLYKHAEVIAENLNAVALNNHVKGSVKITSPEEPNILAKISTKINLQEIKNFLPIKNVQLAGNLLLDIESKGIYNPGKKKFPETVANIEVQNGSLQTIHYPKPIQKINLLSTITNSGGEIATTQIKLSPLSFEFEEKLFTLNALFVNPDDMEYDLTADGTLDIGKIYKVFAIKGYDANGFVEAHVKLKGRQSDAQAGRYNLLHNDGVLMVKHLTLYTEAFPRPLFINSGNFSFKQDKMQFDAFEASYASSHFKLNGYLNNLVNYMSGNAGILKGAFTLNANHINVNEFAAFSTAAENNTATDSAANTSASGVVMIPANLSVQLNATADSIFYNGVVLKQFKGQVDIDTASIKISNTGFRLIDAGFVMNARYKAFAPDNGQFEFKIKADSFSIAKAYNDIPLFREMVSSASGVQGLVGLDYNIAGRIDENMQVVLPSLKGGGVLSLVNMRLKGFRLMNAVSESTDYGELKDADVSGVKIKSVVKNNIINVERIKMRVAGLRPRFEGQASLDGALNMKGRIGLPPLGIIGIPFSISGTSENPVVKLKRDKSGKVLQEKEDKEAGSGEEASPEPANNINL